MTRGGVADRHNFLDHPRDSPGAIGLLECTQTAWRLHVEQERMTMSVEEAAAVLGISRALAYELVRRGELPRLRLGRRVVIPRRALENLVASAVANTNTP